jgi:hypothetical protein
MNKYDGIWGIVSSTTDLIHQSKELKCSSIVTMKTQVYLAFIK